MSEMFCYQCQEAMGNTGCTKGGACGKSASVANLQDLLIWLTKGLSQVTTALRVQGVEIDEEVDHLITENLFTTVTNVNFNEDSVSDRIEETIRCKEELLKKLSNKDLLSKPATYNELDRESWNVAKCEIGVLSTADENVRSVRELITYGVKGLAAYLSHANVLCYTNREVDEFIQRALASTLDDNLTLDELVALTLETGKFGVDCMSLLDKANTETYGNPEITEVNIGVSDKPGILISGHDLKDLEMLLEQTNGTGVDVYTHSEMLPGHYYPAFKSYDNFVGNYGNAWWKQQSEFESFNGPILMTTNCIVPPKDTYKDRIYTTGVVSYSGVKHIEEDADGMKDFSEIIEQAKKSMPPKQIEEGSITGGFAHNQVIELADAVVAAVKSGAIKQFVVMAGCDGRHEDREYYTDFAKSLPEDSVILTAGCAKYRYNKLDLGEIAGIPRVLDAGQCNDCYSLAVIAMKLQEAFGLDDINDLPIVYNIAWYEQKAVIVLLALLSLGVKNIHLGPTLPAFLSEDVVNLLVENFGIATKIEL